MAKTTKSTKPDLKSDLLTPNQDVYTLLREAIIGMQLKPGSVVSIRDLCRHFQINRSPMRDALIRLGQEGLITLMPQRGISISKIDMKRVEEERFLRASVERAVMRLYMEHPAPESIPLLEDTVRRQKEYINARDFRENIAIDDEFHRLFYRFAGKPICADMIWRSSGQYTRVRLLTCLESDIAGGVVREHIEIIDAIKRGDAERVLSIFEHHLGKIDSEEPLLQRKYAPLFLQEEPGKEECDPLEADFLKTVEP